MTDSVEASVAVCALIITKSTITVKNVTVRHDNSAYPKLVECLLRSADLDVATYRHLGAFKHRCEYKYT